MNAIFDTAADAFRDTRTQELARTMAFSTILCLGRHTISGTLTACGRHHVDWSAAYRLFECNRIDVEPLFGSVRSAVASHLGAKAPITVCLDDTLLPRCGKSIAESGWHHDPQGPPFAHQIKWSQRVLQLCAILPMDPEKPSSARAIPLDVTLQSKVRKPGKRAPAKAMEIYKREKQKNAVTGLGSERIAQLRKQLDREGHSGRDLHVVVDGGYTNKKFLRTEVDRTVFIGRLRKDAKLRAPAPEMETERGRPRKYGDHLARPQELLADKSIPWKTAEVYAAGKKRLFKYKCHDHCCWPSGLLDRKVRVIAVQPLEPSHDMIKGRRLFFSHPGYILCSDPDLSVETVLQAYIHRWEIEVGFREQKTTLGLGQAQTWKADACKSIIRFQSYCYSLLLLAAASTKLTAPPQPKWRKKPSTTRRLTINSLISIVRGEMWGKAMGIDTFADFVKPTDRRTKPPKIENTLKYAVIYASN